MFIALQNNKIQNTCLSHQVLVIFYLISNITQVFSVINTIFFNNTNRRLTYFVAYSCLPKVFQILTMDDTIPIISTIFMILIPVIFICIVASCCCCLFYSNRRKNIEVQHTTFGPNASVEILGPTYVAQQPVTGTHSTVLIGPLHLPPPQYQTLT